MTKRYELERGLHRLRTDVVLGARSRARLLDRLAGQHAERDRDGQRRCELREGSRDRMGEDVEVRGLSPDQTAERYDRVEAARAREHGHRRGQLEGAGNLELLHLGALGERSLDGSLGEGAGDLVVPPCANDRHAGPPVGILHPGRSLPRGRQLPQSSPRMLRNRRVTG